MDHRWKSNEDADVMPLGPADRCLECGVVRYALPGLSWAADSNERAAADCPGDGRLVVNGEYA